ncbi:hypothetical protein Ahy_B08g093958 [Arachis hypogaea]|uniref:Uncharacterized protein n=1 Tax=Arachis hypogaea TaxID=3818 RepID=A0A444Y7E1_ARAHY|nr:hypothetical protein Ahy_B08g093958 [Arachis hypogaea]
MPDRLRLVFHHGGAFETDPRGNFIYTSDLYDEWVGVDEDYLDVFAVTGYYKELGYDKAEACWYLEPKHVLEFGLRRLKVDQDLVDMIKHCHENNNVIHIYFEHGTSIPEIIDVMNLSEEDGAIGQKVGMEGMEEDRVEGWRKQASKEPVQLNVDSSSDSYESAEDSLYKPHMPLDSLDSSSDNNDDVSPSSDRRKRKTASDKDKGKKKVVNDEDTSRPPSMDASDYEKEVDDDENEENLQLSFSDDSWKSDELKTPPDSEDEADPAANPIFNDAAKFGHVRLELGMEFTTRDAFKKGVRNYTLQEGRGVRYKKNDTTRCRVVCKNEDCPWMVFCSYSKPNGCWQIKTFNDDHTCERTFKNRCATRSWVTDILVKKVRKLPAFRHCEAAEDAADKGDTGSKGNKGEVVTEECEVGAEGGQIDTQTEAVKTTKTAKKGHLRTKCERRIDKLPVKRTTSSTAATAAAAPHPTEISRETIQGASAATSEKLASFLKFVPNPGFNPPRKTV